MLLSVGIMSVYLEETTVRLPGQKRGIRLFGQFPYLLSIVWVWLLCHLLTVTNMEPVTSPIRTDRNQTTTVIRESQWFSLPYPGNLLFIQTGLFKGCLVLPPSIGAFSWAMSPLPSRLWLRIWGITACWLG